MLAAWALCSQSVNACGSRWANTSSNAARVSSRRIRSPGNVVRCRAMKLLRHPRRSCSSLSVEDTCGGFATSAPLAATMAKRCTTLGDSMPSRPTCSTAAGPNKKSRPATAKYRRRRRCWQTTDPVWTPLP